MSKAKELEMLRDLARTVLGAARMDARAPAARRAWLKDAQAKAIAWDKAVRDE